MENAPMLQLRGMVHHMSVGPADFILVTVKCAKLSEPIVFEMPPDHAKHYRPGMTVLLQVGPASA